MMKLTTFTTVEAEQHRLILDKLLHLRRKRTLETDASVVFKLDYEIEEFEALLRDAEERLRKATALSPSDQLYHALLNLDYKQQVWRFRQMITRHSTLACLIQGEAAHGQRWLLSQLVGMIPGSITAQKVIVHIGRRGRSSSVNALWREIGQQVGLSGLQPVEAISRCVQRWLHTQSVVIILDQIDILHADHIAMIQELFWKELVQIANAVEIPRHNKLLMIMVDYSGQSHTWPLECIDLTDADWQPYKVIRLPMIRRFTQELLFEWINNEVRVLPLSALDAPDVTAEELFKASDEGTPEYIFDAICTLCELRWNDYEGIWTKY